MTTLPILNRADLTTGAAREITLKPSPLTVYETGSTRSVTARAVQSEAFALNCEPATGWASVFARAEQHPNGQIGPSGNNDEVTVSFGLGENECQAFEVEAEVSESRRIVTLRFRRGTETSLMLAALRAALSASNIQHEYPPQIDPRPLKHRRP